MMGLTMKCALAGGVFVLSLLGGCESKGGGGGLFGFGGAGERLGVWQPEAESLRIHVSTRFVDDGDGRGTLQARVEFQDAMGDSIKAVGEYRLELFASDEMGRSVGQRLYQWQVDARTLADQRRYYDSVTRAYVFRLRLDEVQPPTQPTLLRVTFTPAERGERLENAIVISPL